MDDPLTTKGALANFKEGYSPVAPWLRTFCGGREGAFTWPSPWNNNNTW